MDGRVGLYPSALNFDGVDDYITFVHLFIPMAAYNWTYMKWIRLPQRDPRAGKTGSAQIGPVIANGVEFHGAAEISLQPRQSE